MYDLFKTWKIKSSKLTVSKGILGKNLVKVLLDWIGLDCWVDQNL